MFKSILKLLFPKKHFHDWKSIYKKSTRHMMDEPYETEEYTCYEICTSCKHIREESWCSGGTYYNGIDKNAEPIIIDKIDNGELFIEG